MVLHVFRDCVHNILFLLKYTFQKFFVQFGICLYKYFQIPLRVPNEATVHIMTLHTEIPLLLSFLIYGEKIQLQDLVYRAT
jgi:hypothetical protein